MRALAALALLGVVSCGTHKPRPEVPCFDPSKCGELQQTHPQSEVIYYPQGIRPA